MIAGAGAGRRRRLVGGLVAGTAYVLVYLYSIQNIVVAPGVDIVPGAAVPSVAVASDWTAKLWKPIAPFVWEPVVAIRLLPWVALFLSLPNAIVAGSLGTLVGLNVAVALTRLQLAAAGRRRPVATKGVLASIPSLLSGFTCCVPTLVLALGSLGATFTVAIIALRPYFIPAAALALVANLAWAVRGLRCAMRQTAPLDRPAARSV